MLLKKTPNILHLEGVIKNATEVQAGIRDPLDGKTKWVPARGLGYGSFRYRVRAAWLVFTGKADALIWPMGQ